MKVECEALLLARPLLVLYFVVDLDQKVDENGNGNGTGYHSRGVLFLLHDKNLIRRTDGSCREELNHEATRCHETFLDVGENHFKEEHSCTHINKVVSLQIIEQTRRIDKVVW